MSVSRVLSRTIIHLGCLLPNTSSNLPAYGLQTNHVYAYLVLLRVGFTLPRWLPNARCALTTPFHPYPFRRYIFCGTFPKTALKSRPAGRYPAPCLHGARTFLPLLKKPTIVQHLAKTRIPRLVQRVLFKLFEILLHDHFHYRYQKVLQDHFGVYVSFLQVF
jgi:hypothetical protein